MHWVPLALIGAAFCTNAVAAEFSIPFTKEKLPNGLTLIFHEDHALPVVVVELSYKVGSRYEEPKRTGFAHLFEHLMFMGTRRVPTGAFDGMMEAEGGHNNAWTSEDRTAYWNEGPGHLLPLFLWLEADRLRDIGPLMTLEKLNTQRDVVKNERRQRSENTPYGIVHLKLPELLYPVKHPYHHPVIGSHEDLEAASVDNVKAFFAKYYVPSNASLVIAGDFSPKQAKETIEKWFASMPAVPVPVDPGAPDFTDTKTSLEREVRDTVTDNVQFPKVVFGWQTPKHLSPEDAHLDLLSNVLAGGKASRLYKRLVEGKQLAQEVSANQSSGFLGSQFSIDVLAKPGVSLEAIETEVGLELQELAKNGPTKAELTRSRNLILSGFVSGLQTVRARASLLNAYESEKGDPGFLKHDVARYESATPHDLQRAVATYLGDKRVVLRVMPKQGGAK